MRLKTGEYFIQEVFHSLRRNNWMTFASIGTVAVSLFVLGVFLILVLNMNRLAGMLESQVQISVYLEDHLTDREKRQLGYDIESLQGIDTVTYVDREEAKARLAERLGDQKYLLDALSEDNPLPDAFEVTVTTPSVVESAAEAIDSLQGVEEAKYGQDVVEHALLVRDAVDLALQLVTLLQLGRRLALIAALVIGKGRRQADRLEQQRECEHQGCDSAVSFLHAIHSFLIPAGSV